MRPGNTEGRCWVGSWGQVCSEDPGKWADSCLGPRDAPAAGNLGRGNLGRSWAEAQQAGRAWRSRQWGQWTTLASAGG